MVAVVNKVMKNSPQRLIEHTEKKRALLQSHADIRWNIGSGAGRRADCGVFGEDRVIVTKYFPVVTPKNIPKFFEYR